MIARTLGFSKRELEIRAGVRNERRSGPRVSRRRNEAGRQARTFGRYREEKPGPELVGSVEERKEQVSRQLRDANTRLRIAIPTTPEYRGLLAEVRRLQREVFQLEADAA